MFKIRFTGVEAMQERLRQAAVDLRAKSRAAVEAEAERILAEAKNRVPVDTGELRDSGRVEMDDDRPGEPIRARIVFDAEHAGIVHEDLEADHLTGQAKFLESAMNDAASGAAERMAA